MRYLLTFWAVLLATNLYAWESLPLKTMAQVNGGIKGGDAGQVIFTMRFAPSNSNYVYLATDTSGVWISTDGGSSWQNKLNGFMTKGAVSLAIDPQNENHVLVAGAVNNTNFTTSVFDGIYRTIDGGENWKLQYQTPFVRDNGQDNIFFIDSTNVYCGTHKEGLLKSIDGGTTWNSLNILTNVSIEQIGISSDNSKKVYIGTSKGIYSLVNDTVLTEIGSGLPSKNIIAMAVHPSKSNIIYVITGSKIYKTVDSGAHFVASSTGLPKGKHFLNIEISPVNPDYLYTSTEGQLWYSHNAGYSWKRVTQIDPDGYMADITQVDPKRSAWSRGSIIAPSYTNASIAIGSGDGHYPIKTTDGGVTWNYSGNGFTGMRGDSGTSFLWDKHNQERFAICVTDMGVFLTEDGGRSFKNTGVPRVFSKKTSKVGAFDPVPGSMRIIATVGDWFKQQIIVSTDNGNHWTIKEHTAGVKVHPFATFHPQEPNNVYVGKFFSSDKGDTWQELPHIIYGLYPGNGDIVYSMSINRPNHLTVYKSVDKGQNWTIPYGEITNFNSGTIREMAIDPKDQNRIYVVSETAGLFVWDGSSWSVRNEENGLLKDKFNRYSCQKIAVDPNNTNIIYIGKSAEHLGRSNGVFMSMDKGDSWVNIAGEDDGDFNTAALSVNPNSSILYMSRSEGIYKYINKITDKNITDSIEIRSGSVMK